MKAWTKISFSSCIRKMAYATAFVFMLSLCPHSYGYAATNPNANIDPFQNDTTQWMSFDRYKDQLRHGQTYEPVPVPQPPPMEVPHYLGSEEPVTADGKPTVASPTRALNPPLMPGMNKGFEVNISTTEDNRPQAAQILNLEGDPKVAIAKNWETAAEAARKAKRGKGPTDEDEPTPLDVRMSFLPTPKMTPIPSPNGPFSHGRPPNAVAVANGMNQKTDPAAADFEAWSRAIEAYKKRQLAAIQSDRQTLAALQAAISDLGLQKQLDFMPGANSAVSAQVDMPNPMDVPTTTLNVPVKN